MEQTPKGAERPAAAVPREVGVALGPEATRYRANARYRIGYGALGGELQHRDELLADWDLAVSGEEVFKIDPLR